MSEPPPLADLPNAPTVTPMIVIVLGVALGLAVAFGPLSWLAPAGSSATSSLVSSMNSLVLRVLDVIPWAAEHPNVVSTFAVCLAVCTPGLVALSLAWGAGTVSGSGRAGLGAVLVMLAVAGFFVLPPGQAFAAAALLAAAAIVLMSPLRKLTAIVAWGLATLLAVDLGRSVVTSRNAAISDGADVLVSLSGLNSPEFWVLALSVLALAPFVAAVWRGVHLFDTPATR